MLTINQEIEILKNFSLKHKSLNSYFHEGENKIELDVDSPVYPKFESILESADNTKDMVTRRWKIFVSDLVNKDKSNKDHVISDCELICYDFLYYMRKIVKDGTFIGFRCSTDISLTDFIEAGTDEEAGFYFDFVMTSHIGNYSCALPINAGNILDNNYIYINGSTTPITSEMNILTETFIYDGNPITLANVPIDILTGFAAASPIFLTDDYSQTGTNITLNESPILEIGVTKIRFTYTY